MVLQNGQANGHFNTCSAGARGTFVVEEEEEEEDMSASSVVVS